MKIIEIPIDSLAGFELDDVARCISTIAGVSEISVLEITGQIMVYCEDDSVTSEMLMNRLQLIHQENVDDSNAVVAKPDGSTEIDIKSTGRIVLHLRVQGMHCAGCERAIEKVLSTVTGVESAKAELVTGRATISGEGISVQALVDAITRAGYQSEVVTSRTNLFENIRDMHSRSERKLFWRWLFAFVCVLLFVFALWIPNYYQSLWGISLALACLVQLFSGGPYVVSALRLARYGQTNMDTLIALGTTAAFVGVLVFGQDNDYHMLMESPMILGVVGFGKWLESMSINKAVSQLAGSVDSQSGVLRLLDDGSCQEVSVEEIASGMRVVVRSGEQVRLDGTVHGTAADVNRAWLTGEAKVIRLREGEMVHAGSVNEGQNFTLAVTSEAGETRFDRIMHRLEKSLGQRPQVQQLADKVVAVFVPGLMVIACITLLGWLILGDAGYQDAWRYTVAVLVIACPCALGLATPVATLVSGTRGLRLGGLITNPVAMEQLGEIRRYVLDKTGTLTTTDLEVQEFRVLREVSDVNSILRRVQSLEQQSTHPIARSIMKYCEGNLPISEVLTVSNIEAIAGSGIRAVVGGNSLALVNDGYVTQLHGIDITQVPGATRVWVILDDQVAGVFFLSASCYAGVSESIAKLQKYCGDPGFVLMASGDNEVACLETASQVGIQAVHSDMSPEGKVALVRSLKSDGGLVAIVGDGINDAVALAEADVGIAAFGGTDIATQSADIVMLRPGLDVLVDLIALSRVTRSIIRQNLWWAFAYNILAIPLAAGLFAGFGLVLTPMAAAGIMATSSILVVLNSLRLNRISLV